MAAGIQRLRSADVTGCRRLTDVAAHTRAVTDSRIPQTRPPVASNPEGVTRAFKCAEAPAAPSAKSAVCALSWNCGMTEGKAMAAT